VLTQADPRHRYSGGMGYERPPVNHYTTINVPASTPRQSATQMGAGFARQTTSAARRNG
jgi:hypothetical protein